MIYAKVSEENREKLRIGLLSTKDAKWYRRLKIIDLSTTGKTAGQLAEMFDLSPATVRDYVHRYNTSGIEGLKRRYSPGAPKKIQYTKEQWEELLVRSPSQFQDLNTAARNWTQELLVSYCSTYLGVDITQARLCQIFKKLGIKWNRGNFLTSPDPLYTVKRERIETLKKKRGELTSHDATDSDKTLPPKLAYLVFFDSTDLHWCPDVGNGYALQGEQIKVDSPGNENPWRALFGSLIYPTGDGLYTVHERKRHQEVCVHIELLIEFDPSAFWFIVLDNASAHTTGMNDDFRQQYKDAMEFVFLPTYSPHLNLIERLWRLMRGQMTKNTTKT